MHMVKSFHKASHKAHNSNKVTQFMFGQNPILIGWIIHPGRETWVLPNPLHRESLPCRLNLLALFTADKGGNNGTMYSD